ncbi:hypothetical protein ACLQ2Q_10555, partial [Microbacterium sp. DT81.1]|uniref:hypothetical protein n=1 Tax=Microbacterium sp. DT81.1 TaxID=3393413 RepID=UPI003CF803D2
DQPANTRPFHTADQPANTRPFHTADQPANTRPFHTANQPANTRPWGDEASHIPAHAVNRTVRRTPRAKMSG